MKDTRLEKCTGITHANDSYPPPYEASVRTPAAPRDALVSQVSSPKITKYVEQRGNRCTPGTSDRREQPTHTYEAAPASKGQPAHG